jgi:hypothetical protein
VAAVEVLANLFIATIADKKFVAKDEFCNVRISTFIFSTPDSAKSRLDLCAILDPNACIYDIRYALYSNENIPYFCDAVNCKKNEKLLLSPLGGIFKLSPDTYWDQYGDPDVSHIYFPEIASLVEPRELIFCLVMLGIASLLWFSSLA